MPLEVGLQSILGKLANRDLVIPHLEASIVAERWPRKYTIEVDSGPYYGLNSEGKPDGFFHPSSHALLDERLLYYLMHPGTRDLVLRERISLEREMTLAMGQAAHSIVQTQLQMCDLVRPENIEWQYTNREHHLRGRVDWILDHPNGSWLPCELKTQNPSHFHKEINHESWTAQLMLGMDAADQDLGVVVVMKMAYPFEFREVRVHRDRAYLDAIYAKFDRVRAAIVADTPPRHCCGVDSDVMKACVAKFQCWLKEA